MNRQKTPRRRKTRKGKFASLCPQRDAFASRQRLGKAPTTVFKDVYFSGDGSPDVLIQKIKNLLFALDIPFTYGIKPIDEIGDLDEKTRSLLGKNLSCWFTVGDSVLFGCSFIGLKKGEIGNDAPMVLVTPIAGLTGFEHQSGDWDLQV